MNGLKHPHMYILVKLISYLNNRMVKTRYKLMEINWKILLELFSKLLVLYTFLLFFLKKNSFRILANREIMWKCEIITATGDINTLHIMHFSVWMSCQHYSLLFVRNIPPTKANIHSYVLWVFFYLQWMQNKMLYVAQ